MRKIAREIAFMLIYEDQFNKERDVELSFDAFKDGMELMGEGVLDAEAEEYAKELVNIYEQNADEILGFINENLYGYETDRVYKIDMALLLLAVTEIYYYKTPAPVVINEVVELAKKYSTDKSANFINGILGNVVKVKPVE